MNTHADMEPVPMRIEWSAFAAVLVMCCWGLCTAQDSETAPQPEATGAEAVAAPEVQQAPEPATGETAGAPSAVERAVADEQAKQDLGLVKKQAGEGIVVGVVAADTFLAVKPVMRKMLLMNGADQFIKAADRFSVYLQGYLASTEGITLAEIDSSRLAELQNGIAAGQLGARQGEMENRWKGINGFVSSGYGYGKIKGMGFVPFKHARLTYTPADGAKGFTLMSLAPYSTTGSSDPQMALMAAHDIRDLVNATAEQRELAGRIAVAQQRYRYLRSAGFLLTLLAGAEYIAAGYMAGMWADQTEEDGKNSNGFTITQYACYGLGALAVVASPINPIMAAVYKAKQKKLKKEYNQTYGERYALK